MGILYIRILWVSRGTSAFSLKRWNAEVPVQDWGDLPLPHWPPRHHRIELEGGDHPVSGEHPAPIANAARPRAQPTITPLCGARAWAHRWWRARARRDRRAWAKWSDCAEDRPGARAHDVRPGARAGFRARHGGEGHGQWERGGKLHPLHHGWGWAELSGIWFGYICRHAPSSSAFVWTVCLP